MPMDMVAVKMNKHSWMVDLKQAGRFSGSCIDAAQSAGGSASVRFSGGITVPKTLLSGGMSTMAGYQPWG